MTSAPTMGWPPASVPLTLGSSWCGWGIDPYPVRALQFQSNRQTTDALPPCDVLWPPDPSDSVDLPCWPVEERVPPFGIHPLGSARFRAGSPVCWDTRSGSRGGTADLVTPPPALCPSGWGAVPYAFVFGSRVRRVFMPPPRDIKTHHYPKL
jgi:hypothetical protein